MHGPHQQRSAAPGPPGCQAAGGGTWHRRLRRRPCAAAPAAPSGAAASPADVASPAVDPTARAIGCLLGGMCGEVLGAPHEEATLIMLRLRHPRGIRDFAGPPELLGRHAGGTAMTLAVARSLAVCGRVDARAMALECAAAFDPVNRDWHRWEEPAWRSIQCGDGGDPTLAGACYPISGFTHSGAARVAPIGLAYRHAPAEALREAVRQTLLCSHTHALGVDGAAIQAAAVAWLCRQQAPVLAAADEQQQQPGVGGGGGGSSGATAAGLLEHLVPLAVTDDMLSRLEQLRAATTKLEALRGGQAPGRVADWEQHMASPEFEHFGVTARDLAEHMQSKATDAVASALWALCCHWHSPEDAVVAAVHLGGYCRSVGGMAGALAGALHGRAWVPARWADLVEGREAAAALGPQLTSLDVRGG